MTVSTKLDDYGGTVVMVDNMTICILTKETGVSLTEKFVALCEQNEGELYDTLIAYNAGVEKNRALLAQGKMGRNRPEFDRMEKLRQRLLDKAGIKDS